MTPVIDCNFPGGNIVVEHIGEAAASVHQDLRDTNRDWFYWCFRVRNTAGRTFRFQFTRSRAIGVKGPALSFDEGNTWRWLGTAEIEKNAFSFAFPADAPEVRFSFGMPYQEAHWDRFVAEFHKNHHFSVHPLCTTPRGRTVEYARLGCLDREPAHRIVITCRHHCCEMMSNYTLEGLIRQVADSQDKQAEWLRRNVEFLIVPFVDKDGVEDGDQGKERTPRDHGRDYLVDSIYSSTRAIRDLVPKWVRQRFRIALDLHCPYISGSYSDVIHLVESPNDRLAREQRLFSEILESERRGVLPFLARNSLPFGVGWNTSTDYTNGKSFTRWAGEFPEIRLAALIEIPYANASGSEVNQTSAGLFGIDIARALSIYLMQGG